MLLFSSAATAEKYLADAKVVNQLQQAGITWIGFNMEGDKTPPDEMCSVRGGNDPQNNAVSRFARAVTSAGFKFMWGPIRNDLDRVSDSMVRGMCQAGTNGIAMQEQNTLSAGVQSRIQAVKSTVSRYEGLCGQDFYSTVQVMSRSCSGSTCRSFAQGIMPVVDSIAIWATGSEISQINGLIQNLQDIVQ